MDTDRPGYGASPSESRRPERAQAGFFDALIEQVRAFESECGLVEPLDPKAPSTGRYALSGIAVQRIAAMKGILIAAGQGARLIRIEPEPEQTGSQPDSLSRGIVLRKEP